MWITLKSDAWCWVSKATNGDTHHAPFTDLHAVSNIRCICSHDARYQDACTCQIFCLSKNADFIFPGMVMEPCTMHHIFVEMQRSKQDTYLDILIESWIKGHKCHVDTFKSYTWCLVSKATNGDTHHAHFTELHTVIYIRCICWHNVGNQDACTCQIFVCKKNAAFIFQEW